MKHSFASKRFWISSLACSAAWMAAISFADFAQAQNYRPIRHEMVRGDMPPGLAADYQRMSNRKLENRVQPVRVVGPRGCRIDLASQGGFVQTDSSRVSVGMRIGPVYRLKVTNIPNNWSKELYPSIEVLNKLNPPEGLDNEFPIEIILTEDDLKQALEGRMVTKVIYLENPANAMPHRHRDGEQPFFDVGGGEDPLRAAEKLGKPMAILRVGSRIPLPSELVEEFNFNSPEPSMLPDPQPASVPHDWGKLDAVDSIRLPRQDTPIIPGRIMPIPKDNR